MYGMLINGLHSFNDLGLVATSRPRIQLPEPKLEYLQIPGRQESIDISESLAGEVLYEMREGCFEFIVANKNKWNETCHSVKTLIHGKSVKLSLDDEPLFYYQGRMWVSDFKSDKNYSTLTLNYKLQPYKYSVDDSDGVHTIWGMQVDDKREITLVHDFDMTLIPEFNNLSSNSMLLDSNGKKYEIKTGFNRFPQLRSKINMRLTFVGNGMVNISYKRGWL